MSSSPIVGAFVFPDFWKNRARANSNLARLRDCGVNAIMTESYRYEFFHVGRDPQGRTSLLCRRCLFFRPRFQFSLPMPATRDVACPRERRAASADGMVCRHVADRPQAPGGDACEDQVDRAHVPRGRGFCRFCTLAVALGNRAKAWPRKAARFKFRSGDAREVRGGDERASARSQYDTGASRLDPRKSVAASGSNSNARS